MGTLRILLAGGQDSCESGFSSAVVSLSTVLVEQCTGGQEILSLDCAPYSLYCLSGKYL